MFIRRYRKKMKPLRFLGLLSIQFLFLCSMAFGQNTVTGTVSDAQDGQALPGVNISVKGTTVGTASNSGGSYSLNVPSLNDTLRFTFIGYEAQEVPINGRTTIDITLNPQTIQGGDVIVVGYGTQSTRQITGSVQNLSTEELEDLPVSQFTQKLQGKLSGVQVKQASGIPGEGMQVNIRGQASISTDSSPLYVVDGMPITGDISYINPNEIENISVLKDAGATALYGSRAANGVVLVETKKAVAGQTQINFNAYYGSQKVPQRGRPDLMNAREFAQFKKELAEFNGNPVDPVYQNPDQYGEGTDWYDAMMSAAPIQNYSLSLSTGTERFSTTIVGGYSNQDGVLVNSGYERYSLRINSNLQANEDLRFGFKAAPSYGIRNNSPNTEGRFYNQSIIQNAILTSPLANAVNEDGTLPLTATSPGMFPNPNWYRTAKEKVHESEDARVLSNAFVEYDILDELTVKTSASVEYGEDRFFSFNPSTTGSFFTPPPIVPTGNLDQAQYLSWLNENTVNYRSDIGDHSIDALVGFTAQKYRQELSEIDASQYPDDKIQQISAANQISSTSSVQEWTLLSYLARVNYDYQDKYLFSASIRRDGSSRFGPDNRWGFFPSASVGWILTEEDFMPDLGPISFLKLRASYGVVGNFNIGNYTHIPTITTTNYVFANSIQSGRSITNLADAALGWEKTNQYDVGLDVNLFDGRLQFVYDYYNKTTDDLLYNVDVPTASGFDNIQTNIGKVEFWGHEFALDYEFFESQDFSWNTSFNISFNDNKVLELGNNDAPIYAVGGQTETNITAVGQPIGMFYGMIHDGVYVDQEDFDNSATHTSSQVGTIKFRDLNGDGEITLDDRTVIGSPHPDFIYGITSRANYKNFDFSMTISGSYGNEVARQFEVYSGNLDGVFNVLSEVKDRWRSPEDPGDGKYGSVATGTTFLERDWFSTRFLYDGSHLTMKNITLGYTVPGIDMVGLSRLRVYGSIQNAFILTKYPGPNPEVSGSVTGGAESSSLALGNDQASYPIPRTITIGVNLGF